jgi:hypothetical protein
MKRAATTAVLWFGVLATSAEDITNMSVWIIDIILNLLECALCAVY